MHEITPLQVIAIIQKHGESYEAELTFLDLQINASRFSTVCFLEITDLINERHLSKNSSKHATMHRYERRVRAFLTFRLSATCVGKPQKAELIARSDTSLRVPTRGWSSTDVRFQIPLVTIQFYRFHRVRTVSVYQSARRILSALRVRVSKNN